MQLLNVQKKKEFILNNHKTIYDYVCPNCFRSPEECICDLYSMSLILVDKNLQTIIQFLNDHHMYTIDCCEGHYGEYIPNIYISFVSPINSCPEGFKLEDQRIIRHIYKSKTEKEFEIEKEKMINNIKKWMNEVV